MEPAQQALVRVVVPEREELDELRAAYRMLKRAMTLVYRLR
jgi:hypothetical protein